MEKPELAPDIIYYLMKDCWADDPNMRPDFDFLAEEMGSLLEANVKMFYEEMNDAYQALNDERKKKNDYLRIAGSTVEDYTNTLHR
ncbi:fibroblast growth factor receptor-like [Uloborus diversus]|uniref:fibroblast growth factor receptor-like n=1 Tax=Uloborus diversus TaxID=327109 RepID=UPI0024098CA4|nr:fibroblast growth factor receptor-like [Uloborus diversus]